MLIHASTLRFILLAALLLLIPFGGADSALALLFKIVFLTVGGAAFLDSVLMMVRKGRLQFLAAMATCFSSVIFFSLALNIENYEFNAMMDALSLALIVHIPIFTYNAFRTVQQLFSFYKLIQALVVIIVACSVYQMLTGMDPIFSNPLAGGRITGPFSWGAPVVGSFLGLVFASLYVWVKQGYFVAYAVASLTTLAFIVLGGNRSVLVIIIVAYLFILFSKPLFSASMHQVGLIIVLSVFGLLYGVGSAQFEGVSGNVEYRLNSLLSGQVVGEQKTKRIATWRQSLCMVEDFPLFGVGVGRFEEELDNYLECSPESEGSMPHPHQVHLEILSTTGIFGLLIFLMYSAKVFQISVLRQWGSLEGKFALITVFIVLSPMNVTHGLVSLWWAVSCFIMIGLAIVSSKFKGKNNEI